MSDPIQQTQDKPIRILITDDHFVVRQGLRLILNTADDIELVSRSSTPDRLSPSVGEGPGPVDDADVVP